MIGIFDYIWRNSRREQIKILCIVCLSLPFYYLSLDLPKYIISDALQGRAFPGGQQTSRLFHITLPLPETVGGPRTLFEGVWLDRLSYLFALSGLFLLLVLINGLFKYIVNMRKGALGERLLQRLRFDLFSALLSFRPEALQRIKPSEAATVIKDEVEPVGGFVGDAFVQPVFLGGQALTALAFILVQNLALGLIAAGMILIQGILIPRLRREQIRLARQRQIASRAFAGKIGEVVESIGEIANHGTSAVEKNQVAQRLEELFGIRYRLYERKFAVKMLNNLLAQVTPFLFYAVGGYFALTGHLDLGQLIAVIAAYRDLPPPVKDLIDWDQQRMDAEVKFQQVIEHFGLKGDAFAADPRSGEDAAVPPVTGLIVARGLAVVTATGDCVLDRISLSLPLQRHIALSGEASEGAGILAQGIPVFGAASMGALRAAELGAAGMKGHGFIHRWYALTPLADDDEVAVATMPAELGSAPLSEALINIRLTLRAARRAGLVSEALRRAVEELARGTCFIDRLYPPILAAARAALPAAAQGELDRFEGWWPDNAIDQKRADAVGLLRRLAASPALLRPPAVRPAFRMTEAWAHDLDAAGLLLSEDFDGSGLSEVGS